MEGVEGGRVFDINKALIYICSTVSVGFSARSRHFSLFGGAKIGASATLMEGAGKVLQTCGKVNGNACYAG